MELPNVETKLLRSLVALVEEESVTAAARRLNLSQPRMSNALRRLRELFDDPLLVRAGQHMVATERAREIAVQVGRGLESIGSALAEGRRFDPAVSGKSFVVMMSDYTAALLLPEVLRDLESAAPTITLSMHHIGHDKVQASLEDGVCDLALGFFASLHADLRISKCFADEAVCVVRHGHKTIGSEMTLDQFLAVRHVRIGEHASSTSTVDVMCDRALQAEGHRRRVAVRCSSPYAVARVIASTELVGLLPRKLAEDYAAHLPLRCLPLPLAIPAFDVTMVWHERTQRDPAHIWLRDRFRNGAAAIARG